MKIAELMTKDARTCSLGDTLNQVAQIMWEHDCGAVPITDDRGRAVGIVTDRDISMAAYTQGRPLSELPVSVAVSTKLVAARPSDSVEDVVALMRGAQVRRVPVVDGTGKPVGIVSLADIARHVDAVGKLDGLSGDPIAQALAAIAQPHAVAASRSAAKGPVYRVRSIDGGWEVVDRDGRRVSEIMSARSDGVIHAKELARRDGSAQIIVHREDGSIASEFFFQRDARAALAFDDSSPTLAASRPAHVRRGNGGGPGRRS